MKKVTKKQMAEFVRQAKRILDSYSWVAVEDSSYTHKLTTDFGDVLVRIDEDTSYCYSIYMCFENVEEAKKELNCNPHTGKYNIHKYDMLEALEMFENTLGFSGAVEAA